MSNAIENRETLVAALRERGVDYLAPSDARLEHGVPDTTLMLNLVNHPDPRLRQALIALFLVRPQLAARVSNLRAEMDEPTSTRLAVAYTAAVYLQRIWRIRLGHHQQPFVELPDCFSHDLGLPSPAEGHGKVGLHALAERERARASRPFNCLAEFEGAAARVLELLQRQESLHAQSKR
jgi:hypothetical protein